VHCNEIAPPRYKLGGKWYCSYPELRECHDPAMILVDEVQIEGVRINDIGLGKRINTKKQFDEFATRIPSITRLGPADGKTWR
jgi:hypothetical protein